MAWNFKDIGLAVIYSYVAITILNYLFHAAFPSVPILKTGVAVLILFVGIIISTLFVFARDGNFSSDDVKGFLVVVAVVIGLYFAIRWALPELFSAYVPEKLKEVFSVIA